MWLENTVILLDKLHIILLLPYLLHISQCDRLSLVASVGPALACVPSGAGHSGWRLSQPVEQRHFFCQAEGAEVRLLLTLTLTRTLALAFSLHCGHWLRALGLLCVLHQPRLPCLLLGSSTLL